MKKILSIILLAITTLSAQSAPIIIGPNSVLQWNIAAPDIPTAQSFTYAVTVDGAAPITVTPVTCVASSTSGIQQCSTPVSQLPLGSHTVTMTAASGSIVSASSAPYSFVDLLIPVPTGIGVH
jgi:hypothetical protein